MSIVSHIEFLLMSHDCVIIPGIGAILAHNVPAYFNSKSEKWLAPARVMSFNPELSRTDGLLAQSVARRDNLSMTAASAVVKQQCDALRHKLETERHLEFGAVGALSLSADGRMTFTPGTAGWLSPSTMWLPSLSLSRAKEDTSSFGERIAAEAHRRRRLKNIYRSVSAVACIAVIFALGWIVVEDLNSAALIQTASVAPVETAEKDNDGVFIGAVSDAPADVILSQEPAAEQPAVDEPLQNHDPKYMLIVASLSSEAEARKFISQYKGVSLGVFVNDGRYRIYAASGDSWDEVAAQAYSSEISELFPSSWVCSR